MIDGKIYRQRNGRQDTYNFYFNGTISDFSVIYIYI